LPKKSEDFGAYSTRKSLILGFMSDESLSLDAFQALEQRVFRAVEIVKREREARAAAEAEVATLRAQLEAQSASTESQVATLNKEREAIRLRVENMLAQMDELI
jgi:hypothetical protein